MKNLLQDEISNTKEGKSKCGRLGKEIITHWREEEKIEVERQYIL